MISERLQTTLRLSLLRAGINILLAVFKIFVGVIGSSHALIADGVHSFSDLLSDGLVYLAAKWGERNPDAEHPYGHHRIETIGTIIIALLLVAVGIGIIYDSVNHFIKGSFPSVTSTPVIFVAVISIFINEFLFRYTLRIGEKIRSNLLISNAWHNRADVFVSIIVLLSVIGSIFGIHYFDAIGAVIIAFFILKTAVSLIRKAFSELIDAAVDPATLTHIRDIIENVNGVKGIHMLRTRLHADKIFVDLHILVEPKISVSEGHYISDQVYKDLYEKCEQIADVTVHIDPENDELVKPSLNSPNRDALELDLRAHWKNLPAYHTIKRIVIHYLDGKIHIEIFIPYTTMDAQHIDDLKQQYRNAVVTIHDIEKLDIHLSL